MQNVRFWAWLFYSSCLVYNDCFSNVKIISTTRCKTLNNLWKRGGLWYIYLFSRKQKNPSCEWKLRPTGVGASLLRILAPCCKKMLPATGFPVLLHNGASLLVVLPSLRVVDASLRVDIGSLLSRKPIFAAGRLYSQQDGNRSGRMPKTLAGRVNSRQDGCKYCSTY